MNTQRAIAQHTVSFVLNHLDDKDLCKEVYHLLKLADVDFLEAVDDETMGDLYALVEVILFDPQEYS